MNSVPRLPNSISRLHSLVNDTSSQGHKRQITAALSIMLLCALGAAPAPYAFGKEGMMTLTLTSTAFTQGGEIPSRYTCEGADVSPPLSWSGVPEGTKSLALIVDDPDAPDPASPKMTWVHWVLYNIPPSATGLAENVATKDLPSGTIEGINDWHRNRYGGPCPPIGRHRYFHKLYALDVVLPNLGKPSKSVLEKAMQGHILAKHELMGAYQKR